jgi:hypothetical protein
MVIFIIFGVATQDILAGHFGAFIWRVILAHLFGGSFWRVFTVNETGKLQSFKEKEKKRKGMYNQWICKLHHEHCIYPVV